MWWIEAKSESQLMANLCWLSHYLEGRTKTILLVVQDFATINSMRILCMSSFRYDSPVECYQALPLGWHGFLSPTPHQGADGQRIDVVIGLRRLLFRPPIQVKEEVPRKYMGISGSHGFTRVGKCPNVSHHPNIGDISSATNTWKWC